MRLVVGIDGSADAEAALGWARDVLAGDSEVVVLDAVDDPVATLVETAVQQGAEAIVVGAHGTGGRRPRTMGRVASGLVHRSPVPVVVAGNGTDRPLDQDATVVVGVGRGHGTDAALAWAARLADGFGAHLSLVHAIGYWPIPGRDGAFDALAYVIEPARRQAWVLEELHDLADRVRQATVHDVVIEVAAPPGRAGTRLVQASHDAALLVIGRHEDGHGPVFTMPALHHAVTHAPCPVVVVPAASSGS